MDKNIIVIKIGGVLAKSEKLIRQLSQDMKELSEQYSFIIIHGGGTEVSELTIAFGIEPVFQSGKRITSQEEMKYVDMVLCGKVNKRLVRLFNSNGFHAVGLSGSDGMLFSGKSIMDKDNNPTNTGAIDRVNPALLQILITKSYLPVIASTSMDTEGTPLNINADEVAFELSKEMKVNTVIFFSDIPGILKNEQVLLQLKGNQIQNEIEKGVISGGMIPKTKAAINVLSCGVEKVIIGQYTESGSLIQHLEEKKGTRIIL